MSKNAAIVYAELSRRDYPLSLESLRRICGMNHTVIGQALGSLKRRDLITSEIVEKRLVYRSRQLPLWGAN